MRLLLATLAAAAAMSGMAPRAIAAECAPLIERPAGNYMIPGVREFAYATPAGSPPLLLDAFAQPDGQVHPAVVIVHGGGWTAGSRHAHIGQLLELLTEAGYQWVAIDYRLGGPERRQEAVDDVKAALAFVTCHARALRIDPARLVLLGEDVGAQLVAQVAGAAAARGAVLIGGHYATPVAKPGVPTLVVHGGADSEASVAQARAFCESMVADERQCDLDVVDGASHRLENWWPPQWGYKRRLVEWLRRAAGPGAARPLVFEPQPVRDVLRPGLHKRLIYNRGTGQTLDAWVPSGPGPHVPVVLVHGGGWEAGDRVTYITPIFRPLAEAGFAWFSIDYRLTPAVRHPEQLQDLRDAIAFLRERAGSFNIDASRLVLVGESASAQMVSLVATEDRALAGVVSFYGVYDFLPMAERLTPRSAVTRLFGLTTLTDEGRETLRTYSPLHRAHRDQPPLLLVHGTAEGLWTQGQAMAARLAAIGARHDMLALEGAPHGMENWEGQPRWQHYKTRLVEWIRAVTAAR
jgi:alpha-L-fucosidase 2